MKALVEDVGVHYFFESCVRRASLNRSGSLLLALCVRRTVPGPYGIFQFIIMSEGSAGRTRGGLGYRAPAKSAVGSQSMPRTLRPFRGRVKRRRGDKNWGGRPDYP